MFRAGVGGNKTKAGVLGQWISKRGEGWRILGVWWFKNESTHSLVQLCFKPGQPMGGRALYRSFE